MLREHGMQTSGRRRALVVDGSMIGRLLAVTMLADRNFDVVEAEDAQAALDCLQGDCYDLMLLDSGLPGNSGIALCHKIRHELGMVDLPIIGYTARGDITDLALMRMAGFNDFLVKPVSMGALDQALRHSLAH